MTKGEANPIITVLRVSIGEYGDEAEVRVHKDGETHVRLTDARTDFSIEDWRTLVMAVDRTVETAQEIASDVT